MLPCVPLPRIRRAVPSVSSAYRESFTGNPVSLVCDIREDASTLGPGRSAPEGARLQFRHGRQLTWSSSTTAD